MHSGAKPVKPALTALMANGFQPRFPVLSFHAIKKNGNQCDAIVPSGYF